MSQNESSSPDFNLPDDILSVIPADPYEQLDLARKITSIAIASRVTKLESETARLRQKLHDKDLVIVDLEDKLSRLHHAFQDSELGLKMALEDNMNLLKERDSLAVTAKKLGRDLVKLETFKRQLMQSLNDDNSSAETVDIGTYDQSIPRAYPAKEDQPNGFTNRSFSGSTESVSFNDNASRKAGQSYLSPYITPRFTPTGTPKVISTSVSPRRYSAAGSPQKTSAISSPVKNVYDERGSLSSFYPSSQQSSAASSPTRSRSLPVRTPRVDGKEFFRQARSRLSYEQFSAFLANIKELNAHKQSREETLRKAEEIFGTENKDLYISFQGLLNKNTH